MKNSGAIKSTVKHVSSSSHYELTKIIVEKALTHLLNI